MFLLVAVAVASLGLLAYQKLFPSDEILIRRLVLELATTASVSHDEKPLTRLTKGARLAGFFTESVVFNVDVSGLQGRSVQGRDELTQLIVGVRANLGEMSVEFRDVTITVDGEKAGVHTTALARISGQTDLTVQELMLTLARLEGKWLIERVDTIRTLR